MAIIPVNIENLKPDKEYLVTVRSKNSDVNVVSQYADSIRFSTPKDSTIPNAPTGLELAVSFFSVLFKFDVSVDEDAETYEYELYAESQVEIVEAVYQPKSGEIPHRTGFSASNVFLISVESNSSTTETGTTTNPVKYYGRVRTIDTSGNHSDWSQIVQSGDTPLIDEEYIGSLTAAKITAGTIGAYTISLNGQSSIIKSSTYDFSSASPSGWYIEGDGSFSFGGNNGINYDGSTVVIGTDVQVQANLSADSLSVGSGGNILNINDSINSGGGGMTLGSGGNNYWYANGYFRTGDATNYMQWDGTSLSIRGTLQFPDGSTPGTFDNGDALTSGTIGGVTISSSKIYIGTGTWNSSNTAFYVDNSGNFSLKDKFSWNSSSDTLNITGTIVASVFKTNDTSGNRIEIIPDVASQTANADSIRFYSGASGENSNNTASIRNESGTLTISAGGLAPTGGTSNKITFGSIDNGAQFNGSAFSSAYTSVNNDFYFRNIAYGTLANRPSSTAVGSIYLTI